MRFATPTRLSECNYGSHRALGGGVSGYSHFENVTSAEECQEICNGVKGCYAWGWTSSGFTPANRCSMKKLGFRMEPKDPTLVTSGIKMCRIP